MWVVKLSWNLYMTSAPGIHKKIFSKFVGQKVKPVAFCVLWLSDSYLQNCKTMPWACLDIPLCTCTQVPWRLPVLGDFSAKDNLFCFEINTKMSCLAFINQICLPQWWDAHKWGLCAEFSFSNFTVLHASSLGTLKGLFASGTWEKGKNKQKEAGFGPCIRLVLCSSNSVNFSEFWTRIIGVAGKEAVN